MALPQTLPVNSGVPQGHVLGISTEPSQLTLAEESTLKAALAPAEPLPSPTPSPTPKPITQPSPTPVPTAPQLAPHELDALFQKYGTEYGVSWEKLKVIAKCESGYRANAIGGGGLYGGMYQYVASTWSATRKAMGLDPNPELRFNAEEAIRTTAWKIAHGGLGAWPVCGKK